MLPRIKNQHKTKNSVYIGQQWVFQPQCYVPPTRQCTPFSAHPAQGPPPQKKRERTLSKSMEHAMYSARHTHTQKRESAQQAAYGRFQSPKYK